MSGAQWGVIGRDQLSDCGVSDRTIRRWRSAGRLHTLLPSIYAVGHPSVPIEGRMVAALLHAGPGSVLSHTTAAWWWGLIAELPSVVEVATPVHARSAEGVLVHRPRSVSIVHHRRFPVTSVARTLVDLAACRSHGQLRRALSEADYLGRLDAEEVRQLAGRGRFGSTRLRRALDRHDPQLALTRSGLERAFLALCHAHGLPAPEVNKRIGRMTVDMVWERQRVAVELGGHRGHRSPAQLARDRRRELHVRAAGYLVVRYSEDQVAEEPDMVAADLHSILTRRKHALSAR